ncbi:spore maturation protein CgeB [Idiomarina fontislapidosi]|uniref:Spore protein YkvP/CgeB glycosyl transferase-like domain-containing protein n=1 Tax=Idiomarina fontislapidosi TaxID=263723 RepID=A0A432XQV1_9GAMM|nr:glycosyltransferase [Idiomarina fontislapidosi]PYE30718.1 spore maturation protein CgeB [Idiomarina fontislapidosi]RUO51115.1 hypothetical protein CWE25_11950 [Idiomarina fontislapidosi]
MESQRWLTVNGRTLVVGHDGALCNNSALSKVLDKTTRNVLCLSVKQNPEDIAGFVSCSTVSLTKTFSQSADEILKIFKPGNLLVDMSHPELEAIHKVVSKANIALTVYVPSMPNDEQLSVLKHANYVWVTKSAVKTALEKENLDSQKILYSMGPSSLQDRLHQIASQHDYYFTGDASHPAPSKEALRTGAIGEASQKTLSCPALTQAPLWQTLDVSGDGEVTISASSFYSNCKDKLRKAVVLVQCFNKAGKQLDSVDGRLAYSKHLKSHFKYLPCTQGEQQALYSFKVPATAEKIKIGFRSFNCHGKESVELKSAEIDYIPPKDAEAFIPPSKQAAEISILGWPDYPPNGKPYVLGVMDEFTTGCFSEEMNLIQPRPDNWYALAEKYKPELIFIESAWKGNLGSWQYRVADYGHKPGQEVSHMAQYAKQNNIPMVFWNKEDPVHHQKFMCSAKLADVILTTDANMTGSYQEKTGNEKAFALPFAAQPALHKPAPLKGRKQKSCFAGSWYGDRHKARAESMGWLLDAAHKHGLEIYDRNHGTGIFPFPDKYAEGIKGSLPYVDLCDEYRNYRVFLNVNSVIDSPTMFSRRVFELMASGTPVVSTAAKGIEELFESDAVWLINSAEEADQALTTLMTDDNEWRRRSLLGIREVFAKHTYAHRMKDIYEYAGLKAPDSIEPIVALVALTSSDAGRHEYAAIKNRQTYSKATLIVEDNEKALNEAIKNAKADFVIHLDVSSQYGDNFVQDLVNATRYKPEAFGWAKSHAEDEFAFNKSYTHSALMVRKDDYAQFQSLSPEGLQAGTSDIFVIDSDEYQCNEKKAEG